MSHLSTNCTSNQTQQINTSYKLSFVVGDALLMQPTQSGVSTMTLPQLCHGITKIYLEKLNQQWWCSCTYEQNCLTMERCNKANKSSKVMIISLRGRWKLLVSRCHL